MLDQRIRCDMPGMTTLSPNWKGWEVFRLMEAGHGYVKISSWMHSQWLLCSTAEGTVTTCSHSDSFLEDSPKGMCSKWAIEKSIDGNGVVIRSKTHDRLLSVIKGVLKTFCKQTDDQKLLKLLTNDTQNENELEEMPAAREDVQTSGTEEIPVAKEDEKTTSSTEETSAAKEDDKITTTEETSTTKERETTSGTQEIPTAKDDGKTDRTHSPSPPSSQNHNTAAEKTASDDTLWKQFQQDMKNVQDKLSGSRFPKWSDSLQRMQENFKPSSAKGSVADEVPEELNVVWQLEAAHLQTYYFSSGVEGENRKTIGPFPSVTPNLRKTDKFQLVREGNVTKLLSPDSGQYVACTSQGEILYIDKVSPCAQDGNTEWIMDKPPYQEGGHVFKSVQHKLYLSYKDTVKNTDANTLGGEVDKAMQPEPKGGPFRNLNPFNKKPETLQELVGSDTVGEREVWNLDPCMPRAVSSEKIKTFALGTTIAMPFALAGMGAMLGAVGAEMGIAANILAVGLTGAEATASMGVIGMTAYIVFRPDVNSLTDDHEEKEIEKAWSKRPFSNWRKW